MDGSAPLLMLIEDDDGTRHLIGVYFRRRGWEVCDCASVSQAINQLDRGARPELIVLDLLLPDGSGERVLRRVRQDGLHCRVAVYTGNPDLARHHHLRELRPDLILSKGLHTDVLLDLCQTGSRQAGSKARPEGPSRAKESRS